MTSSGELLQRIIARSLPSRDRDAILGDLAEEAEGVAMSWRRCWMFCTLLRIAFRYHVEPYREAEQGLASVIVLLSGLGMLWVIPEASSSMFIYPELLDQPFMRLVALAWGASHVTSAIAIGLLVGRNTLLPECGIPTRLHLAVALALSALVAAPAFGAGVLAASVLVGSVVLGDIARRPALN